MPEAEPEPGGSHTALALAVPERRLGVGAHRLEEVDQGPGRDQRGDGPDLSQAGGAQLQERISTTRIVEVHAGNGQVKCNLLVWLEGQIGQVERVAIDEVPVLLVPGQPLRPYRDALVAQQPLVSFKGLAPRRVLQRIAGNLQGDRVERERMVGVQQHQHQVGHTFKSVESCRASHRGEPTAAAVP